MVIWKYDISPGVQTLELPKNAKVLTVQSQRNQPKMWVLLNPDEPYCDRVFWVLPTGKKFELILNEELVYINTFQIDEGDLVFHLFEVIERKQ